MHLGVIPHCDPFSGGSYQYSLTILDALMSIPSMRETTQRTLFVRSERELDAVLGYWKNWSQATLPFSTRERVVDILAMVVGNGWLREAIRRTTYHITPHALANPDRKWSNSEVRRYLKQYGIDWVFYTTPNAQSFEVGLPYVMPVYDLQHRLQPGFLEVSANGEWERREYLYRNGTREAVLILADSEVGKEDILDCYGSYGVTPDRVKVLPYLPAPYLTADVPTHERLRVRRSYRLPERYLLYPAQLWPHKNHLRVVRALGFLKDSYKADVHVVLCGTHSGAIRTRVYRDMMHEADRLQVAGKIHYLGYVPNSAMSALYAEAVGLVMPTFFGPTNIPIMEAWLFGCPVLTSDIRGIREQVGEAGILVDPRSVEAIASGINRLWGDEGLRTKLAQLGTQRLARYNRQDFCAKLTDIIAETNRRVAGCRLGKAA